MSRANRHVSGRGRPSFWISFVYIQADCNVCSAAYRATDEGTVEVVGPVPCTLAWCSSAPLDARYLSLLQSARSWSVGDGTLELSSAEGVLRFTRAR